MCGAAADEPPTVIEPEHVHGVRDNPCSVRLELPTAEWVKRSARKLSRPPCVTAAGMLRADAADLVWQMAGPCGLPDALRQAGTLACLSRRDTEQAVPITAFIAANEDIELMPGLESVAA